MKVEPKGVKSKPAEKRFEYVVSVTIVEAGNERARRHASIRGEVEAPVEEFAPEWGQEATRRAVADASERCHAGRLMGGVADDGS